MKITEVNDSLEQIDLPGHQKRGILQVIDAKITDDMQEVIVEIKKLEEKMQLMVQLTHDKLSNEIKTVYWVVGVAMTIMLCLFARK